MAACQSHVCFAIPATGQERKSGRYGYVRVDRGPVGNANVGQSLEFQDVLIENSTKKFNIGGIQPVINRLCAMIQSGRWLRVKF